MTKTEKYTLAPINKGKSIVIEKIIIYFKKIFLHNY